MQKGETIERRSVFRGRVLDLAVERVRLPNGNEVDLELARHPGAAAVVPVDEAGNVYLVRQYRHATGGWLLELPAGKLDPGEAPEDCARRELEEETGFHAGRLEPLGWIWTTPGFTDERIALYLATELRRTRTNHQPDEVLELESIALSEAIARAERGEIHDAKSICGLFWAGRALPRWCGACG